MKYSHFIGIPMSSIPREEHDAFIEFLKHYCSGLSQQSGKPVFCASLKVTHEDFDAPRNAYDIDIEAIENSEHFVMIYPVSVNSSVTGEAFYATALKTPVTIFVKDKKHLPFLMRDMDKAEKTEGRVQIIEYHHENDILAHHGL